MITIIHFTVSFKSSVKLDCGLLKLSELKYFASSTRIEKLYCKLQYLNISHMCSNNTVKLHFLGHSCGYAVEIVKFKGES